MSFNFGLTSSTAPSFGFGNTATNKPTGFGTTFSATSTAPTFGTPATSTSGFSGFGTTSTGFGTAPASTGFGAAPASSGFGTPLSATGFGAPTASTGFGAPTASTGFGAPTASTGFGAPTASTGFGTTSATGFGTAPTSAFGFGAQTATTSAPSTGLGFGSGFGQTTATTSTPNFSFGGGFGTTATSAPTGLNFGSNFGTTTSTPSSNFNFSGFGSGGTTTLGTSGGGLFSQPNTGFGGLGSAKPAGTTFGFGTTPSFGQQTSLFGQPQQQSSLFGQPQQQSSLFGQPQQQSSLFGQPQQQSSLFGQPQQQSSLFGQPQQVDPNDALFNSVFNVQIFGDERDKVIERWNFIQALWGTGKGYYNSQASVDYDMKNPLCRFKAVTYSVRHNHENKDGLVNLVFMKKESEIRGQEQQMISILNNILGNRSNIVLNIHNILSTADNKTIVIIYVEEKSPTGGCKRVPANTLANHFLQTTTKQQLASFQVENIYPLIGPDQEQLNEYLENPPAYIDPRIWKKAQDENPMPSKLLPVPVIGFQELRWRLKCQEQETALHQAFLDKVADNISELKIKHSATVTKIAEYRRKFSELQHRLLKVLIIQELNRKCGLTLLPEEEIFKSKIEAIYGQINLPQFKQRLSRLMEGVKCQAELSAEPQRYVMDPNMIAEIKQFLLMEQSGMAHVRDILEADLIDLKTIKDGLLRFK